VEGLKQLETVIGIKSSLPPCDPVVKVIITISIFLEKATDRKTVSKMLAFTCS
jgi:hypothetical protein